MAYKSIEVKCPNSPIMAGLITTAMVKAKMPIWITPGEEEHFTVAFPEESQEAAMGILNALREKPEKRIITPHNNN